MRKDFVRELVNLGQELSDERDKAHDLWTWLPSHKVAEKHHGDYASEFCPSPRDVMIEAALFVSCLKDGTPRDYTPEEKDWFERCPCGEDHVGE